MAEDKLYDVGNDAHYKELISTVSEKETITATDDIYTSTGQKLVSKGTQINANITANLAKHKLQSPIDDYVQIDNPVTTRTVISDIDKFIAKSSTLQLLFNDLDNVESIEKLLRSHQFPNSIAFKLSIAKSEREDIYVHSLLIMCLTYFIACKAKLGKQTIREALLAALFHDLGLLHLDPEHFHPSRKLNSQERKYLNVHVIISNLIIEPYPDYQGTISTAVLDHHERMDGSGYPNGKNGDAICTTGQILGIAVVVASQFNHDYECVEIVQLELLLNMNRNKLNREFYKYFNILFSTDSELSSTVEITGSEIKEKLGILTAILKTWLSFNNKGVTSSLNSFIASYIDTLYESCVEAGVDLDNLDFLIMMCEQDALMKQHVLGIIKESSWQLHNLVEELKRRNKYQLAVNDKELSKWLSLIKEFTA